MVILARKTDIVSKNINNSTASGVLKIPVVCVLNVVIPSIFFFDFLGASHRSLLHEILFEHALKFRIENAEPSFPLSSV